MAAPFIDDRNASRQFFLQVWEKYRQGRVLEPLEELVLGVILEHPEYHDYLENEELLMREFLPESGETNPFLHMGMHIAIREQVSTDRPAGIRQVHQKLSTKLGSSLEAEHLMLECLGETLWEAQRQRTLPDEARYLERLKKLL